MTQSNLRKTFCEHKKAWRDESQPSAPIEADDLRSGSNGPSATATHYKETSVRFG
jgi:hypothetical protein